MKLFITALVLLSGSFFAEAEDTLRGERRPSVGYVGVLAGGNNSSSSEGKMSPTLGLTVGAKLAPSFGIAFLGSIYGQTSSGSLFGLPTGTSTSTIILAGQASYFLGGLHFGAEIGSAISSWSGRISSLHTGESTPGVVFGPQAGYDLLLGDSFSLGVEGHYLVSTIQGGVNNLQLFAALKVWQ